MISIIGDRLGAEIIRRLELVEDDLDGRAEEIEDLERKDFDLTAALDSVDRVCARQVEKIAAQGREIEALSEQVAAILEGQAEQELVLEGFGKKFKRVVRGICRFVKRKGHDDLYSKLMEE